MHKERQLVGELLEFLPEEHPAAVQNRREIARLHVILGTAHWLVDAMRKHTKADEHLLELAAGDGFIARKLVAAMPKLQDRLDGLDLKAASRDWPGRRWVTEDARAFAFDGYDVVFTCFFLHHLTDEDLRALGERLRASKVRVILACETLRSRFSYLTMPLVSTVLGLNPVSRYDARASFAAGFRGEEMIERLGLGDWDATVRTDRLGVQYLEAVRR